MASGQLHPLIDRLDPLVLTVRAVAVPRDFHVRVPGMEVITFEGGRWAPRIGRQKINLHEVGKEFEPKAARPTPGSADLCVVASLPLTEVIAHLHRLGTEVVAGPVRRTGALGPLASVYVPDPDGNLIGLARYAEDGDASRPG